MLEHRVEDDAKLAHTGCESQLLRLAAGQQSPIEVPDDGVVATGYQCSHVEGRTAHRHDEAERLAGRERRRPRETVRVRAEAELAH